MLSYPIHHATTLFLLLPVRQVAVQLCKRTTITCEKCSYFFLKLFCKPRGVIRRLTLNFKQHSSQFVTIAILLMVGNSLYISITLLYATSFSRIHVIRFPNIVRIGYLLRTNPTHTSSITDIINFKSSWIQLPQKAWIQLIRLCRTNLKNNSLEQT